jgi:hypothetical protein
MSDQLTKTEHRLFWYLFKLDRYGSGTDIPSQSEIAIHLGVSRKAINQAQATLERLGLWEFRVTKWKGRNLAAKGVSSSAVTKRLHMGKKGYSELPESDRVQPKGYSELPESDSDIYKERAHERSLLDLNKTKEEEQLPSSDSQREDLPVKEVEVSDKQFASLSKEENFVPNPEVRPEDLNSAVPPASGENFFAAKAKLESRLTEGKDAGKWLRDAGFVDWYVKCHLVNSEHWKKSNRPPTEHDARRSIRRMLRQDAGEVADLYSIYRESASVTPAQYQSAPDTVHQPKKLIKLSGKR